MKKFVSNITLFFIALWSVAFGLQTIIDKGLQKQQNDTYKDWNLIFNGKINSDIVILGSSRGYVHFNPQIIEKKTDLSCYNLSIDGGMLAMQFAKWRSFINHNKAPKILILNVDLLSLGHRNDIFGKSQFLPYLSKDEIFNNLKVIEKNLYFEKNIPLFKYHSFQKIVFNGLMSSFHINFPEQYSKYKGFKYKTKTWTGHFDNFEKGLSNGNLNHFQTFFNIEKENLINSLTYNENRLVYGFEIINSIINDCKINNVKVFIIHTPMYYKFTMLQPQQSFLIDKLNSYSNKKNVEFWDYSSDSLCFDTINFEDALHLNNIGAEKFSTKFAERLNKYIKKNNSNTKQVLCISLHKNTINPVIDYIILQYFLYLIT